jgi:hypothetical protein
VIEAVDNGNGVETEAIVQHHGRRGSLIARIREQATSGRYLKETKGAMWLRRKRSPCNSVSPGR